jgi:hypothetical protein
MNAKGPWNKVTKQDRSGDRCRQVTGKVVLTAVSPSSQQLEYANLLFVWTSSKPTAKRVCARFCWNDVVAVEGDDGIDGVAVGGVDGRGGFNCVGGS